MPDRKQPAFLLATQETTAFWETIRSTGSLHRCCFGERGASFVATPCSRVHAAAAAK